MNKKQSLLVVLAFVAVLIVGMMPFNNKVAGQMNVFSAYLCEQMMNGAGSS
jgi:hypothetical protein